MLQHGRSLSMSFDICIFTHHELCMMCDYTYVVVFCFFKIDMFADLELVNS